MKLLKYDLQIERQHCMKNRINRLMNTAVLMLALVSLMSAAMRVFEPVALAQSQEIDSGWIATGNLNATHTDHSATLLANGNVLVVGGTDTTTNSAELYDPETGTWSVTGNLSTARYGHTATLLQNGKVLVAGGLSGSSTLDSAELYDPDTGTWSMTGNLNTVRSDHTATLLANGKVLVVGGWGSVEAIYTGATHSAELYDPDTGTWTYTYDLNTARLRHTATLLESGKVLVVGGATDNIFDFYDAVADAESYDPETGMWSDAGYLNVGRYNHTATLLDSGKVLVAGGIYSSDYYGGIVLNSAELYDPATRTWRAINNLNIARKGHTATLLENGRVLVTGGYNNFCLNSAELYDPATGVWGSTASLKDIRLDHAAILLDNGKVLVTGGYNDLSLNSAELYDQAIGFAIPKIISVSVAGKKLFVLGNNFDAGAVVLINGEEQTTRNDAKNPQTALVGKKAGKRIKAGDRVQVRNPNGALSQEFIFTSM